MDKKSIKKHADYTHFNTYIEKVLKQVHPDTGSTKAAKMEIDQMIKLLLSRLMKAINLLTPHGHRKSFTSREVQSAVRLIFPGELVHHATSEGTKAVTKYLAFQGEREGKKTRAAPMSRSTAAGLQFPVTRVETMMLSLSITKRKGSSAGVYMAAVLEYITAEILELAGNVSRDHRRVRITPRCILFAVRNDTELDTLFKEAVLSGGVIPFISGEVLDKIHPPSSPRTLSSPCAYTGEIYESIGGITKPALRRLMYRAGVIRIDGGVYEFSRMLILGLLEEAVSKGLVFSQHVRRKTLNRKDLLCALKMMGIDLVADADPSSSGAHVYASCGSAHKVAPVKTSKKTLPEDGDEDTSHKHRRSRPGMKALRSIRYQQKHSQFFSIAQAPFRRLVKDIARGQLGERDDGVRFTRGFMDLLQLVVEDRSIRLYSKAYRCSIFAKRDTLQPKDMRLAMSIMLE